MSHKYLERPVTSLVLALLLVFAGTSIASTKAKLCKSDIKTLLKSYEKALNGSNVDKVLQLYAKDGVFMPSGKPTSRGQAQVRTAYQHVFKDIDLDVSFHIKEIEWHGDMAFVRTVSDGKIKIIKSNTTVDNNTRELFVMKRIDSDWKIYRYMFNKMTTPKK